MTTERTMRTVSSQVGIGVSVEEIHLLLLQALPEGVCFRDLRGAIRFWNDAAEAISGFSAAEAVCARLATDVFFLSDTAGRPMGAHTDLVALPGTASFFLRHRDGHAVPISVQYLAVRGQDSSPLGTLILFAGPQRTHRTEWEANETNGRSTWLKDEHPDSPLQWLRDKDRPQGVLLAQIDDFENLARRLGPEAAEKVIASVERTTRHCLSDNELCQRLPGGLILASTQAALQLPDLAERLRGLVESSRLQWWGEAITFTVSIGGTAVGTHDSVADAVRRAEDNALQAAREGGNRVILAES